jgi:hypothetical protein
MWDSLKESPWWAKFVALVGLPGALLTLIIWFVFSGMASATVETNLLIKPHVEQSNALIKKLDDYMYVICLSNAKNDTQRFKCEEIHSR